MALHIAASDLSIALAIKAGTLHIVVRESRYGLGEFWSIEDDHGVIEVALSAAEAHARIKAIEEAIS